MSSSPNYVGSSSSTSNGPNTPLYLAEQGFSLSLQFDQSGDLKYLESAIAHLNKALTLTPKGDPFRSTVLGTLAQSFMMRFKTCGNPEDINKATVYGTEALNTAPAEQIVNLLIILGVVYTYRFSAFGQPMDLERSLSLKAQAICFTPPDTGDLPGLFNELGISLLSRFKLLKDARDIDHAIMCQEQSLLGTRLHEEYPKWLMNLGATLRDCFQYLSRKEDIDQSIKHLRRAATLIPDGHIGLKVMCLNNLASALGIRFDHVDELADLDDAIITAHESLLLGPAGYPHEAASLNNLGFYLHKRFGRLHNVDDINQAILYQQKSVLLASTNGGYHPEWYSNLGNSLANRFQSLSEPSDLDESIRHLEYVVKLTDPSDPLRGRALNSLGISLQHRFNIGGKLEDIEASINHLNEAVSSIHSNNAYKAIWIENLGLSYMTRFKHLNRIEDLDQAIIHRNHASSLIPEGHASRSWLLHDLASSYQDRWDHSSAPRDLILAIRNFHEAAILPSGSFHYRFLAAMTCAGLCISLDQALALKHFGIAMNLLPRLVWLGVTIQRRYEYLSGIGPAVTMAAAAAIASQQYEQALEWLEHGRSVVWQQTLGLRTPFDELGQVNPALADQLKEIGHQLDHMGNQKAAPASEQDAQKHRRLAENWERVLEEVRRIPNFDNFMRPRKATELVQAARSSVVVVVNVHEARCDALVLRPGSDRIAHVPLPDFSYNKAAAAHKQMIHTLQRKGVRNRGVINKPPKPVNTLESILSLLWWDVVHPVLDSLGYTETVASDELPHITWCTTGPLAFLPLHAAGCYGKRDPRVFNYAISSYTPTLGSLLASRESNIKFQGILAVGQENTPNLPPLPETAKELDSIKKQARDIRYTQLKGEEATMGAVLDAIEKHSWVHLACHATQNTSDPTASAFHLHDGPLSLATIMQKSFKHAQLAFLSACQTATGDADLPEEAVHLAAGMLLAGFPAVIATMWSIQDKDAPLIAEQVYAVLLEGKNSDSRKAAKALHKAVARLREEAGEHNFTSWVPYIHIGI